jgi:hypothetical protein
VPQVIMGSVDRGIILTVRRRQHLGHVDYWDGNWLLVEVKVRIGAWHADYEASIRSDDFARFRQGLDVIATSEAGSAVLMSMDGYLDVEVTTDGRGPVSVKGTATDEPGMGANLEFQLSMERGSVAALVVAVDEILAKFPVLGTPDAPQS